MGEFLYGLRQRTERAPIIQKLGALRLGMEQTPVIFHNKPYLVESVVVTEEGTPRQYICVRDLLTDTVSDSFGKDYYFASAFVNGDTLYVFATSRRDNLPMTMYASENQQEWHDPRGGQRIRMFKTTDMVHWNEKDVLVCEDRRMWNTSVCKGDGQYVMAIEVSNRDGYDLPQVGRAFTTFFATSPDLENWTPMPNECSYTDKRYNACPTLRYSRGYYYMICLEALPCMRYAPYIYRTKNFIDWEVGFHNPIMMWGDDDRTVKKGVTLSDEELDILEHGLNINCSDVDLFEYEGKTHIYYANGDQMTYSFLCEAVCDLPLDDFLEAFFK